MLDIHLMTNDQSSERTIAWIHKREANGNPDPPVDNILKNTGWGRRPLTSDDITRWHHQMKPTRGQQPPGVRMTSVVRDQLTPGVGRSAVRSQSISNDIIGSVPRSCSSVQCCTIRTRWNKLLWTIPMETRNRSRFRFHFLALTNQNKSYYKQSIIQPNYIHSFLAFMQSFICYLLTLHHYNVASTT